MAPPVISKQDVLSRVRHYADGAGRGKFNPVTDDYKSEPDPQNHGGQCLNTGKDGEHCLASQILHDLGVPVPKYGDKDNGFGISLLRHESKLFTVPTEDGGDTVSLLIELQMDADRATRHFLNPATCAIAKDWQGVCNNVLETSRWTH